MSYRDLYEDHFASCLKRLEQARESKGVSLPEVKSSADPLFVFEDEKYNLSSYKSIVEYASRQTEAQLPRLFCSMLQDQISVSLENDYNTPRRDPNLPLYLLLNDDEAVVFYLSLSDTRRIDRLADKATLNSILIVVTYGDPDDIWWEGCQNIEMDPNHRHACNIEISTLQEFFERYFTVGEYATFIEAKNLYLSKAKQLISKSAVDVPTETTIAEFSNKCKFELKEESRSYREKLLDGSFDQDDLDRLAPENIDGVLFDTLFKREMAFSKSYISGEWFYGVAMLTDQLEKTSAIAGTLKAVEQLLRRIVDIWVKRDGREIAIGKDKKTNSLIPGTFQSKDESIVEEVRAALRKPWALEHFFHLSSNRDLFNASDGLFEKYLASLKRWRRAYRNEYFHGGSVSKDETAERVRRDVQRLLLLMFAYLDMDLRQLAVGSTNDEPCIEKSLETDFGNWVIQILNEPDMRLRLIEGDRVLELFVSRRPSSHAIPEMARPHQLIGMCSPRC